MVNIVPAPVLDPKPTRFESFWVMFRWFLLAAVIMALGMVGAVWFSPGPFNIMSALLVAAVSFGLVAFAGAMAALGGPTETAEEHYYRLRLERAAFWYVNQEQMAADANLIGATYDNLKETMDPEEFKKIKDTDIIRHTIERARIKKA